MGLEKVIGSCREYLTWKTKSLLIAMTLISLGWGISAYAIQSPTSKPEQSKTEKKMQNPKEYPIAFMNDGMIKRCSYDGKVVSTGLEGRDPVWSNSGRFIAARHTKGILIIDFETANTYIISDIMGEDMTFTPNNKYLTFRVGFDWYLFDMNYYHAKFNPGMKIPPGSEPIKKFENGTAFAWIDSNEYLINKFEPFMQLPLDITKALKENEARSILGVEIGEFDVSPDRKHIVMIDEKRKKRDIVEILGYDMSIMGREYRHGEVLEETLKVINRRGDVVKTITTKEPSTDECYLSKPVWSPDGKRIAYVVNKMISDKTWKPEYKWRGDSEVRIYNIETEKDILAFSLSNENEDDIRVGIVEDVDWVNSHTIAVCYFDDHNQKVTLPGIGKTVSVTSDTLTKKLMQLHPDYPRILDTDRVIIYNLNTRTYRAFSGQTVDVYHPAK